MNPREKARYEKMELLFLFLASSDTTCISRKSTATNERIKIQPMVPPEITANTKRGGVARSDKMLVVKTFFLDIFIKPELITNSALFIPIVFLNSFQGTLRTGSGTDLSKLIQR